MRGIKFRFWDGTKGNMAMCYQDEIGYFKYSSGFTLPFHQAWLEANATEGYDKPKALMQYTGLKDKNGKEIYEGDIVKEVFEYNETTDGDRELDYPEDTSWDKDGNMIAINQVVFQNGAFGLIQEDNQFESFDAMRGRTDSWDIYDCEVIGNIYENKELLK